MTTRLIVDESIGPNTPLWKQFHQAQGDRPWQYVFLSKAHPGIPDVEVLEKLLGPDTVLLTGDRVLHTKASERGFRSYTLTEDGQLTRRRLRGVRPLKPTPQSVHTVLQDSYVFKPASEITSRVKLGLTEKQFKRYRTARRRIRSHFGSAAAISQVAITVGSLATRRGLLCGFMFHIAGNSGVKGLRATEGYCLANSVDGNEACPVMHALRELYLLQLDQVPVALYIIPVGSLALSRRLLEADSPRDEPSHDALARLLHGLPRLALHPCVKGDFFDAMNRKLEQLRCSGSNELTSVDFRHLSVNLTAGDDLGKGAVSRTEP